MSVVYLSRFRRVTNSRFKVSDAIMKHNSTMGANTMEFSIGKFAVGANTMVKTIDSRCHLNPSLRSRRYLGGRARKPRGGMRRRKEKWEGRERNSACRKAICFLIFRVCERTRNSDWLISHQGFPNYIPCGFR